MLLCSSSKRFARHARNITVSFVLLIIWMGLRAAFLPSVPAYASARVSAIAPLSDPQELATFVGHVLTSQMADNHIPGATVSVVKDGHLLLTKGYGYTDIRQGKRVMADSTLFRMGSVSKLFTWTALMQLVEEGKVNLHADINTYLKTFRIPTTYSQPITVENLLTHTTGFEDDTLGQLVPLASDLAPLGTWLPRHIPARVRPPGVVTAYSDYGAGLAGYIVEQVSGVPFEQYVEQHILQPLDMSQSSFRQPLPANLQSQLSQGYTYNSGTYRAHPFEYIEMAPAGGLSSTATDMAHFMIAQLQLGRFGNTRILQAATAQQMQQQHFTNDPRLPGMAYGFYEQQINNLHLIGHSGDTNLFYSLMMLLPPQHIGVFVAFNSPGGGVASSKFLQAFLDHYYPSPKVGVAGQMAGYSERVSQIEGSYWSTRSNETTYQKVGYDLLSPVIVSASGNGRIAITGVGSQEMDLVEVRPWIFKQINGLDDTIIFRKDSDGMKMFIGNRPYQGYQKNVWYETPYVQLGFLLLSLLLFLVTFIAWPLRLIHAIREKSSGKEIRSELPRWLGWIMSTLNVIVLVGLILLFNSSDPYAVVFATSPALTAVMVLASIAALLTPGVVICNVLVWRMHSWSWWQRLFYVLLTLVAIVFSIDLNFWHLLWLPFF